MLAPSFQRVSRLLVGIVDMALLGVGLFLGMWIRVGWPPPPDNSQSFLVSLPWALLFGWLTYYAVGLYVPHLRSRTEAVRRVVVANLILAAGLGLLAFWLRAFALPRSVIILSFVLQVGLLGAWRVLLLTLKRWLHGQQRVLVVGSGEDAQSLADKLQRVPHGWFHLVDALGPHVLLAKGAECLRGVDVLLIGASTGAENRRKLMVLAQEAGVAAYIVPDLYDILTMQYVPDQLDDIPVLRVLPLGLSPGVRQVKRVLDLVVAVPLAVVAAPIVLVAALAITLTSPGGAFYRQERVGEGGRVFTIWKLRTMVHNAEWNGPQLAGRNDPRVTPLGGFLRRIRIDELPQLWNVLLGEMSFVGPRPERPVFVERFNKALPGYSLRHLVKPGITGLAQVLGTYSTTPQDKLRHDLHYIRNYSLWMDLKIMLLTLRAVLSSESAQGVVKEAFPNATSTSD